MAAVESMDKKESQYDELIDYSHYVAVNDLRSKHEDYKESDEGEELYGVAHFMMRNSAWDPYKQSLLAICLIEKSGNDAVEMWHKVLYPLEKAYENTSGEDFKNRFGYNFFSKNITISKEQTIDDQIGQKEEEKEEVTVGITREYAITILKTMSSLAKEAGQLQDTPENEKKRGVLTPFQKAEREAKKKLVAERVAAARKAMEEEEMKALEAAEKE